MRTAGAACCARAAAVQRKALANTHKGIERKLFILSSPEPFLGKAARKAAALILA